MEYSLPPHGQRRRRRRRRGGGTHALKAACLKIALVRRQGGARALMPRAFNYNALSAAGAVRRQGGTHA